MKNKEKEFERYDVWTKVGEEYQILPGDENLSLSMAKLSVKLGQIEDKGTILELKLDINEPTEQIITPHKEGIYGKDVIKFNTWIV